MLSCINLVLTDRLLDGCTLKECINRNSFSVGCEHTAQDLGVQMLEVCSMHAAISLLVSLQCGLRAAFLALQTVTGLHRSRLAHMNISPESFIVRGGQHPWDQIRIISFGCSRKLQPLQGEGEHFSTAKVCMHAQKQHVSYQPG